MSELFYPLSLMATTVEMTVCFSCARNLWRMRRESIDRSRRTLALGSLFSGLLAIAGMMAAVGLGMTGVKPEFLNPWLGVVYLTMHILMTLYPIMVVRPHWLTRKHSFFIFLPTALFPLIYLFFLGRWTPLETPADIWANWLKPDVLARLLGLFIMLPYCLILFVLPYNYKYSSASFRWILNYSMGLLVICVVHIVLTLTNDPVLIIVLPILVSFFFIFSMEYELNDRLLPQAHDAALEAAPEAEEQTEPFGEIDLWTRIVLLMDREEVWRDPDLSLVSLSRLCATNVTYLNRIIKENTGTSFKEFLNCRRVEAVAKLLQQDPDTDIQAAFFNAGFRSRTTAWRNFKDIMGVTPTEYRQKGQ